MKLSFKNENGEKEYINISFLSFMKFWLLGLFTFYSTLGILGLIAYYFF